ncbi:Secreted effector protein PipB2 [Pandoraea iniqua]|nr:Secreted effector protein PipB2 [Pandoraea iniqua]
MVLFSSTSPPTQRYPSVRPAGRMSAEDAVSYHDLEQRSAAPPEALRRLILCADKDERRVIGQQVAWLVHVLGQDVAMPARHAVSNQSDQLDHSDHSDRHDESGSTRRASQSALPFDEQALAHAWRLRFSHLAPDGKITGALRALIRWCSESQAPASAAHAATATQPTQWHWVALADADGFDVSRCHDAPVREWPAAVLSVALTLTHLRNADLPDLSVPMADLRGVQASGARLSHGGFDGVQWGGASLNGAMLDRTRNVGADFEGADLRDATFRAADLSGARLSKVRAQGADFRFAAMTGADFSDAQCDGVAFAHNRLDDASLRRTRLQRASFYDCRATGMRLTGASAAKSQWDEVTMVRGCVAGADLRRAVFRHCELTGLNAREAKLDGVLFFASDLRDTHFGGASLNGLRVGPGCHLGGTQWQGAQIRLDADWLRALSPAVLGEVVQSWMTLPFDQPALRADVFGQLLRALAGRSGVMPSWLGEASPSIPSLARLRIDVQHSEWLGRLLAAEPALGGVGELDGFAQLRAQWLTRAIGDLSAAPLGRVQAAWVLPALLQALLEHCLTHAPEAVWPLAGAVCQTLYWAEAGVAGIADADTQALRKAWHDALPAHLHSALSVDGTDAFGPKSFVLISADGRVGMRVPQQLLAAGLEGDVRDGEPVAPTASNTTDATASDPTTRRISNGWQWLGIRVATCEQGVGGVEGVAGVDGPYAPGDMSQLHTLIRDFGCLRDIWPTEHTLAAFVRLLGRWLGDAGGDAAKAILHSDAAPGESLQSVALSTSDRVGALVGTAAQPDSGRLRPLAHLDIDDVFRAVVPTTPETEVASPSSRQAMQATQRTRLLAIAAGLTWLAVQPECQAVRHAGTRTPTMPEQAAGLLQPDLLKHYALAAFNDAMSHERAWRELPQSRILRAHLADPACDAETLAGALAGWLASPTIQGTAGLTGFLAQTLPWFWLARLPLTPADTAALLSVSPAANESGMTPISPDNAL